MINRKVEDTPVQCAVAVVELRNNIGDDPLQMPLVNLLPALRVHAVIVARASDSHSNNRVGSKGLKSGMVLARPPNHVFCFLATGWDSPDGHSSRSADLPTLRRCTKAARGAESKSPSGPELPNLARRCISSLQTTRPMGAPEKTTGCGLSGVK